MTLDESVHPLPPEHGMPRVNGKNGTESLSRGGRDASHQDLGLAILIAENAQYAYEPVGVVMSVREAIDASAADFQLRMRELENGGDPLYPDWYVLWARDSDGIYRSVQRIDMAGYNGPLP